MKWKAPNNVASVFFDREAREFKWSGNIVRRLPLHDRPWSLKFVTLLGAIHFTIVLKSTAGFRRNFLHGAVGFWVTVPLQRRVQEKQEERDGDDKNNGAMVGTWSIFDTSSKHTYIILERP